MLRKILYQSLNTPSESARPSTVTWFFTCMLPWDVGASNVAAYRKGEGNCPYNALSQHLSGDYRYAEELRCWVAYELVIQNEIYYDASRECLYYNQPSTELIKNVVTLSNFSSVLEVMAAANILGINIVCHYPEVNSRIRPYFSKKIWCWIQEAKKAWNAYHVY